MIIQIENTGSSIIGDVSAGGHVWIALGGTSALSYTVSSTGVLNGIRFHSADNNPVGSSSRQTTFTNLAVRVYDGHPSNGGKILDSNV